MIKSGQGSKGRPNTQMNWSTDCQPQDELELDEIVVIYFQLILTPTLRVN
jgi:hypothetical protein